MTLLTDQFDLFCWSVYFNWTIVFICTYYNL